MLYAQEQWINKTEGYRSGDSGVYETFTDDMGELYRAMLAEYGRCTGRVYIDRADGTVKPIGWVFVKRRQYDDSAKTFLCETWVTVHNAPPTRTISYDYV